MSKPLATATYSDTWAGNVAAHVEGFKTKRKGETVMRYRWTRANASIGIWSAPFTSIANAMAAAQRHPAFSNVQPA